MKISDKYILEGHKAVACEDLLVWALWFETHSAERIIKQETVGQWWVSTVFLGLDHSMSRDGVKPLIFETMVFGVNIGRRPRSELTRRCSTWEEAEAQHAKVVKLLKRAMVN